MLNDLTELFSFAVLAINLKTINSFSLEHDVHVLVATGQLLKLLVQNHDLPLYFFTISILFKLY
jgi:hypothetical protein